LVIHKKMLINGIVVLALLFWFVAINYYTIIEGNPVFRYIDSQITKGSQTWLRFVALILLLTGLYAFIHNFKSILNNVRTDLYFVSVVVLLILLTMNSVLLLNGSSLIYALLFASTLLVTYHVNHHFGDRFFWYSSLAVVLALVTFILIYGFPIGRWIGGIHPNHIGAYTLLATFFAARSGNNFRFIVYAAALALSILVSSRFAMGGIIIILFSDFITQKKVNQNETLLKILLFFMVLGFAYAIGVVHTVLLLDDPNLGLDSGFTGRADIWQYFWGQFIDRPFLGFGFRQRESYAATHNGFLNFLLENGVFAMMALACGLLWLMISTSIRYLKLGIRKGLTMGLAFWLAWAFAGFFQPQLINFGDAYALMTSFLFTMKINKT